MSDTPVSRSFRSQRLDLHYVDWGSDRPILILLHGGNDHARSWDATARALSDRFRVIAPDLRGHGDSGWSNDGHYSITGHVYDLLALYDALGVDQAPIVGHSFGGMISSRFAGLYPAAVTRMVLLESATDLSARNALWLATPVEQRITSYLEKLRAADTATPRAHATIDEAARRLQADNRRLSDDLARHLAEHGTRLGDDGLRRWKFDARVRPRSPFDISAGEQRRLRWRIEAPVLILDGAESYGASDQQPLDFPRATRLVIAGAGHWVHHDRPEEVVTAIREFLA